MPSTSQGEEVSGKIKGADTLISAFRSQNCEKNKCLCFKAVELWCFILRQHCQPNMPVIAIYFYFPFFIYSPDLRRSFPTMNQFKVNLLITI